MKMSRPSGRRIGVICLLAVLVALPAIVMGPLRSNGDSTADASVSAEEAAPQVRRLYLAAFVREPDVLGWQGWVNARTSGRSLNWVAEQFTLSNEFQNRYGTPSDDEFVRLMYKNVLNRTPDPIGWAGWRRALRQGATRGQILVGFSESPEFVSKTDLAGPSTTPPPTTPTTAPPTTPTTAPPTTPTAPPPTGPAPGTSSGGLASIASNFNVGSYLRSVPIPQDMSWEPSGNFRTFCAPSHLAYDDPIVRPGQPGASHLHQFFGNLGANANSTYQSLRTSGNSTCEGGPLNRSGYWTPAMFDGSGNVIPPSWILVYYKGNGTGDLASAQQGIREVQPFPNGLRMVAGNDGHSYWRCEGGSSQGQTIPNSCPQGENLLGTVVFPMCWDGRNLDSSDHRSHMSYMSRDPNTGRNECPSSHPVHVPEITETFYYKWGSDMGNWFISSDRGGMITPAPDGSTLHADWFGAWDNSIQDRWVNNCIRGMRNGNNGDLCDGQGLVPNSGGMGSARVSGYTPAL